MSFTHVLMCIDEFRLVVGGTSLYATGALQEEIRFNGWFLSDAEVTTMEMVFAAANGEGERRIPILECREWSEGIWQAYGRDFGERARHCRFRTSERLCDWDIDPSQGRLRVVMADGVVMERALGVPPRDEVRREYTAAERALVGAFESIGENCEFGLVQRRVGFERMSLFRFTGVLEPLVLAEAIRRRFEGFAEGASLAVFGRDGEWILRAHDLQLELHTGRTQSQIAAADILREERTKLQFLASKFMEDLEEPHRIFVYRALRGGRGGPDGTVGMGEIYDAMCSYGGEPRLLWVHEADDDHVAGTVEHVRGQLFRGWVRRLSPHFNAFLFDTEMWLEFLAVAQPVVMARERLEA